MKYGALLLVFILTICSVEGCGNMGAGAGGKAMLLLLPIIVVAGAGQMVIEGVNLGAKAIGNVAKGIKPKRNSNLVNTYRKRAMRKVGYSKFQQYYQDLHELVQQTPNIPNLVEIGTATFFLGQDLLLAEEYLLTAIDLAQIMFPLLPKNKRDLVDHDITLIEEDTSLSTDDYLTVDISSLNQFDRISIANAFFVLALVKQFTKQFIQSWAFYDLASIFYVDDYSTQITARDLLIYNKISRMDTIELIQFLQSINVEDANISLSDITSFRNIVYEHRNDKNIRTFEPSPFADFEKELTTLRRDMSINGSAYSHYLHALYGESSDPNFHLTLAITKYQTAIEYCDKNSLEVDGMYYFNMGKAYYYLTYFPSKDEINKEWKKNNLDLAILNFIKANESYYFGTLEEGFSMLAQCFARQGDLTSARDLIQQAEIINPRVFTVDLESEIELETPWPLAQDSYTHKKIPHELKRVPLLRPRWCDNCMSFIKVPVAFSCKNCEFLVHLDCASNIREKHCWGTKINQQINSNNSNSNNNNNNNNNNNIGNEENMVAVPQLKKENSGSHIHQLVSTTLHKPTWCTLCNGFIKNPVNNLRCKECKFVCHKECFSNASLNSGESVLGVLN